MKPISFQNSNSLKYKKHAQSQDAQSGGVCGGGVVTGSYMSKFTSITRLPDMIPDVSTILDHSQLYRTQVQSR